MSKLSEQLKIQSQINKVLQQRSVMLKEQASQLTGQAKLAKQLCKALDCKDLDDMEDRLRGINDELKEASKTAKKAAGDIDEIGDAATRVEKKSSSMTAALAGAGAAVGGLSGALGVFKGLFGIIKGATSLIGSVVGGIFKIGKSILAIPFGIFQGLLGMAQSGGGGPSPIRLQLEEIRESMGSLASNEGKALKDSMLGAKQSFRALNVEGVSFGRIYGYGPKGAAEAGKSLLEIANALGPQLDMLTSMTKKNQLAMDIYKRGLGLTAAQMRNVADLAKASGQSLNDYATTVASYAINMGKEFGISSKNIAKDMGAMMEDFGNFGRLGPKVMSSIAVFTRQLGFEAKELTGVIDKFDNFEDAAQAASKLNQVFGIQIDAMQQMKEQDPAKRLQSLQQAFAATGKSVEAMSRQELKLLASTSGLSEKAAALAFSQKGMAMSYDDVLAGAEGAEGKQLSQAEAMKELADSIKKSFGSGGAKKFKGFFDAFTQGFGSGIKRSREFRRVMRNIRRSLREIYLAGKRVGKAFVELFPGVKQTFKGLGDLFDPRSFRKLGGKLVDAFKDMFKRMQHDPKGGARAFFAKLKEIFGDFFSEKSPAIQMIKDGATRFATAMSTLVAEAIRALKPKIIDGLKTITEFIKDPSAFINAAENAGGFISTIFGPIVEALTEGEGPDSGITGAFKELFTTLWDKIGPDVEAGVEYFVKKYLVASFTIIIAKALAGAVIGAMVSGFVGLLKRVFGSAQQQVPQVKIDQVTITNQTQTLSQIVNDIRSITLKDIAETAIKLTAMGLGLAVALGVFMAGMVFAVSRFSVEEILKALGVTIVLVPLALAVAMGAQKIAESSASLTDIAKAVLVIGLAGTVVAALGAMGALAAWAFKAIDLSVGQLTQFGATTALLTALAIAVAFSAAFLGTLTPTMPLIAGGALVIGLAGLVVVGLGALGALGASAFKGVNPAQVDMLVKVVNSIVPLAIITAVGAAAIGLAIASSFGGAALMIIAGMVTLGEVADEMGDWVSNFTNKFAKISKSDVEKALIASEAAIVLVKGAAFALNEALNAGLAVALNEITTFFTGSNPMEEGMKGMGSALETMSKYIPKMMKDMVDAVRGVPPEKVKQATEMLEKIMKALEPMIETQKASMRLAAFHSALGADPKEIEDMFLAMEDFVAGPVQALSGLITSLKEMGSNLDPSQIEGVKAMATLLGALAETIAAITSPLVEMIKASETSVSHMVEEGGLISGSDKFQVSKDFDEAKFEAAMRTLAKHIGTIVTGISTAVKDMINNLPDVTPADAGKLAKFSAALGPAAAALAQFVKAIGSMMGMGDSSGLMESLKEIDMLEAVTTSGHPLAGVIARNMAQKGGADAMRETALGKFIGGILFVLTGGDGKGGIIGMIGTTAKAFANIDLSDIATANLGQKTEIIGAMGKVLGDFAGLIKRMVGVAGSIPADVKDDAVKKVKYLNDIADFMLKILVYMGVGVKIFVEMMIKKIDEFIPPGMSTAQITKVALRIKTFMEIFKALDPITKMINSLAGFMSGGGSVTENMDTAGRVFARTTTTASPAEAAGKVKDMLIQMTEALAGEDGTGGIQGIIELFTGKPVKNSRGRTIRFDGGLLQAMPGRTRTFRGQLKTLTAVMGAVGEVSSMISSLKGVATNMLPQGEEDDFSQQSRALPSKLEMAVILDGIVEGFGGESGDKLKAVIEVFKNVAPSLKGFSLPRNIDGVFSMINEISTMISDETFKEMAEGKYSYILMFSGVITGVVTTFKDVVSSYSGVAAAISSSRLNRVNLETIESLAAKIYTIDQMINASSSTGHGAVAAFTAGKLEVKHTFPSGLNANLEITVNLDKVKVAEKLITARFHKDGGKKKIKYVPSTE
jgi:hypothetical protein